MNVKPLFAYVGGKTFLKNKALFYNRKCKIT